MLEAMLEVIIDAAGCGDKERVMAWLGAGGRTDARAAGGLALLMVAAICGQLRLVESLLQRGASVNLTSKRGGAGALFMAVGKDQASGARRWVRAGADPEQKWNGDTALQLAKERGAATCVTVIEKHLAAELAAKAAAAAADLAAKEVEAARHAKELLAEVEAERYKGKQSKKKKKKGGGGGTAGPPQEAATVETAAVGPEPLGLLKELDTERIRHSVGEEPTAAEASEEGAEKGATEEAATAAVAAETSPKEVAALGATEAEPAVEEEESRGAAEELARSEVSAAAEVAEAAAKAEEEEAAAKAEEEEEGRRGRGGDVAGARG